MSEEPGEWHTTANRDQIRDWAATRDAEPAVIERPDGQSELRLRSEEDGRGEQVSWERFFELLAERGLVVRYREGASRDDLQEAYALVRREDHEDDLTAEKTREPGAAESDQIATSDTGDSEPAIFDRVGDSGADREEAASTPSSESERGSVDGVETLVVDEIHEHGLGPDEWEGSDEYVVLKNTGEEPIDLSGWTVENEAGRTYEFSRGTTLQSGEHITLHSGAGEDTEDHRYWNAEESVLQESGDTIRVRTAAGEHVLTESYKSGR